MGWPLIDSREPDDYYDDRDDYDQFLIDQQRARNNAESPRRQKLFRKAEAAMSVTVAMRGRYQPPITVTAWYGRHGRRLGLFTHFDDDHEIQWRPRGGFTIVESGPDDGIPF